MWRLSALGDLKEDSINLRELLLVSFLLVVLPTIHEDAIPRFLLVLSVSLGSCLHL
ncbi:hypothetical protein BH10BDE1_BH10BDE1_13850 [soil metagenome]